MEFLPSSIGGAAALVLVAVSFLGSLITAALGIGGGMVLLAAMATVMPAPAIIPVHGVVQLGSNAGRAAIQRAHIDWRTFAYFGAGAVLGVAIGGSIVVTLPATVLRTGLGLFILYTVWGPKLRIAAGGTAVVVAIGVIASFLTMFFGATGPFMSALLRQRDYKPRQFVATHAVCMTAQHLLKIVVFGLFGFAFAEWAGLIVLMLASGFVGTYLGSHVLNRLPAATFANGLKAVLTVLALNLLGSALGLYQLF